MITLAPCRRQQGGVTFVELMVATTLGLLVILATLTLVSVAKSSYLTQDDDARIQETARYALDIISRTVRQTAYVADYDSASVSTAVIGLDARSLSSTAAALDAPLSKAINGSDVLAVRFSGNADGALLNCAGFSVNEKVENNWSIFYVANDSSGEPELRCKYHGKTSWTSDAIARGVESFQVLYGLDTDADGLANRFVNAAAIGTLNPALPENDASTASTAWDKVVAIKVALLIRGIAKVRNDSLTRRYDLFGADYTFAHATADPGALLDEKQFTKNNRNRIRKAFVTTIQLRNRMEQA